MFLIIKYNTNIITNNGAHCKPDTVLSILGILMHLNFMMTLFCSYSDPHLQMGELRLRKASYVAPHHRANEWWDRDINPHPSGTKARTLNLSMMKQIEM